MEIEALGKLLRPHGVEPVAPVEQRPLSLVLRGRQVGTDKPLFVKVLTSRIAGVRRNFAREIDILKSLSGRPGITTLVASCMDPRVAFHACEPVGGRSFVALAFAPEGRDLAIILRYGAALAHWLLCLHRLGVVHRDLSPGHVFVRPDGTAVVIDFGMAKRTPDLPSAERRLCKGYDLQAVGMVLWETICGRAIFPYRDSRLAFALRQEAELVQGSGLPAPVRRLLLGCFAARSEFTPDGMARHCRFESAVEVANSFAAIRDRPFSASSCDRSYSDRRA